MAAGGTLSRFQAASRGVTGPVTVTVLRSTTGIDGPYDPTTITCELTAAASSCSDLAHSVVFAAGDALAVRIQNATGTYIRNVRWTARYQ
jgi:hypothetical protein